jgi:hypothetical protein
MSDPAAILVLAVVVCTAGAIIIKTIASAVLRMQELKYRTGSGLLDGADDARLRRIEHAVEAIAVEVERISENQRFTTKLLSERSGSADHPSSAKSSHG